MAGAAFLAKSKRSRTREHLYELRTGNREKRYTRLARDRASEKRLACARRAHEEYPFRNTGANIEKFFRIFEKIHYFAKFFLGFSASGHIFESNLLTFVIRMSHPRLRLAEGKGLHAGPLNLPREKP